MSVPAPRIPDDVRDRVRASFDIVEVIGRDIRLKRAGAWARACCPFHDEKTASFKVSATSQRFKCFGCDAGGDVIDWIMRHRGVGYPAAVRALAAEKGIPVDGAALVDLPPAPPVVRTRPAPVRAPVDEVRAMWNAGVPLSDDVKVAEWVRSRGLDPDAVPASVAVALPLGTPCPAWARCGGTWAEAGYRVLLAAYDSTGTLVGLRARSVMPGAEIKTASPAGVSSAGLVYANLDALGMLAGLDAPSKVVVVEGEPDLLAAVAYHDVGGDGTAVLGLFNGSWSDDVAARIPDGAAVHVWTHDDEAGNRYAAEVEASVRGRCKVVRGEFPVRAEGASKSADLADLARDGKRLTLAPDPVVEAPSEPVDTPAVDDVDALVPPTSWRSLAGVEEDIANRPTPKMLWPRFLASREVGVVGGEPKAGKTEAWAAFVAAVTNGSEWLGVQVEAGHVVVVTEEGDGDLVAKLRRYGARSDHLHILSRDKVGVPPPWTVMVQAAVKRATAVGAVLLVVDTFGFWAGLIGDDEKNEGVVGPLLKSLQAARDAGLATLLVAHTVKAADVEGIAALRGSGAFAASVEAVAIFRRSNSRDLRSPRRKLDVFHRTYGLSSSLIERVGVDEHGKPADPAVVPFFRIVSDDPVKTSKVEGFNATERKILEALGLCMAWNKKTVLMEKTGLGARTLEGALPALAAQNKIQMRGTGAKGSPLEYAALGVRNEIVDGVASRESAPYSPNDTRGEQPRSATVELELGADLVQVAGPGMETYSGPGMDEGNRQPKRRRRKGGA